MTDQFKACKPRLLTLEVEVIQPEANWLWDSHMRQPEFINGVRVMSFRNGSLDDALTELEKKNE